MDPVIIALVLVSATTHPVREFLLKRQERPESAYLGIIVIWFFCALLHAVLIGDALSVPLSVYPAVGLSILGLFIYYLCVLTTMQNGDLSIYYPIIRASPIFVVFVAWLVLGNSYDYIIIVGIFLTVLGAFFIQYSYGPALFTNVKALLPAILAMVGSGIYTIADSLAMARISPSTLLIHVYFVLTILIVLYFTVTKPVGRPIAGHLMGAWRSAPVRLLVAGLVSYGSYILILTSFQLGGDVAAVSSLRQVSIPISVIVGAMFLGELQVFRRFFWAGVLAVGILIIVSR